MAAVTLPALTTSFLTVPFFLVTILLLIPFVGLIHFTNRANKSTDYHSQLTELNQMELEALDGNFHHFKEDGNEFADANHHFSYDLDIFGKGSIFQLINRTTTPEGKQSLAALFNSPFYDAEKIKLRQEALFELSGMPHFRQRFYALSKMNRQSRVQVSSVVSRKVLTASMPKVTAMLDFKPNTDRNCARPWANTATG